MRANPDIGRPLVAMLVTCAAVAGCGTIKSPTSHFSALMANQASAAQAQRNEELEKDYQAAMADCVAQGKTLQGKFFGSENTELSIAAVGIVAGSVVVPSLAAKAAASKSAIAGWGGLSGAANGFQYSMNNKGASAFAQAAVYNEFRSELAKANEAYGTATTDIEKQRAISKMTMICRFPPIPAVAAPASSAS
jgi:hypothetical protein